MRSVSRSWKIVSFTHSKQCIDFRNALEGHALKLVGTEKPIGERTDTALASLHLSVSEQVLALIVRTSQKRWECFLVAPTKAFHEVPTGYCEKVSVTKGDVRIRTPIAD